MVIENKLVTFDELKASYSRYITNKSDLERIEKAYKYADKKHEGQFRKSGDPYVSHVLGVAMILSSMQTSPDTIIAGLLHDTIEDTDTTKEDIEQAFGSEVAFLVESLTKITRLSDFHNSDFQAEDHRKIFLAMAADIRVIIIKLADRLHNMRTLQFQPPAKQVRISNETLDVYVPIAHRLGLNSLMSEMQNLSLYYLHPDIYNDIEKKLQKSYNQIDSSLQFLKAKIQSILSTTNLEYEISARVKSIYSIYKKMYIKNKKFEDIYDILALRIITKTETNCYEILGYIHSSFTPVPGRFKDYIAVPKPNMYQSLHTTILSGDGHVFEIQIRTKEMDETAEGGIAAHWRYKEGTSYDPHSEQKDIEARLHWFKDFVRMSYEGRDDLNAKEYESQLKEDIFNANVYVFTPKGKVIDLPNGATPIDFAYRIHTGLGNSLSGAKVNNKLVPLSTKLKTGDMVEIITRKDAQPNSEWLNIAGTGFAKSHIRKYLSKLNSEFTKQEQVDKGRNSLKDSIRERKLSTSWNSIEKLLTDQKLFANFQVKDLDDLYFKVANKTIMPNAILDFLNINRSSQEALQDHLEDELKKANILKKKISSEDAVLLENGDSALISLANCCTPIPGDEIIGYVSKGRGIKVHRKDCPNIAHEHARIVSVIWNPELDKTKKYPVDFVLECYDRNGLLVDIMNTITSYGAGLTNISARYKANKGVTVVSVTALIDNASVLDKLFTNLMNIKSVYSVKRTSH